MVNGAELRNDILAAKICKLNGRCLRCGSTNNLEWAHIWSRRYHNTRWDLENCMCLCSDCHKYFTANPNAWETFVIQLIGKNKYWTLYAKANASFPIVKPMHYSGITKELRLLLKEVHNVENYRHCQYFLKLSI